MSDTTTTRQDQATPAQATATDQATTADATPAKLYASKAEAEAAKPTDATKNHKVYEMAKAGAVVGYLWARGYDNALALTARIDGYTASLGSSAPITKEAVLAKLATLSDAELTALGLSRAPATTTPAATDGTTPADAPTPRSRGRKATR